MKSQPEKNELKTVLGSYRMKVVDIFSIFLVGIGVTMWILPMQILRSQPGAFVQGTDFFNSLIYIFLATQLTTVGVAFYAYSLSTKRMLEGHDEIESAIDQLEALLSEHKLNRITTRPTIGFDVQHLRETVVGKRLSRIHLLAAMEGVIIILLYGWLVADYQSEVIKQGWVQLHAPWLDYLLNGYALIGVVGLVTGLLASQLGILRIWRRPKQARRLEK